MTDYATDTGSLSSYRKGRIEVIDDDPKRYVFSNMFEVAAQSKPYERVAVGKNFEYVVEAVRAEGGSPWYAAAHDEFVVCLDGKVEVHLVKLDDPDAVVPPDSEGAHVLAELPAGRKMGRLILGMGHMGMLPAGAAYRFHAETACTLMIQTIDGPATVHRWSEICLR